MRKRTGRWTAFVVLAVTSLAGGCSSQDSEGLKRVCHKVTERGQDLTGGPHSKLATSWQALRGSAGSNAIDSRVAIRLSWDKTLATADIRVTVTAPGVVKLEGTIGDQGQRGRAVELAKATQGVTDVVDALEIKPNGE
jgi:hypothetical protein